MTRYTYNDLAWYLRAINRFRVVPILHRHPTLAILRARIVYDEWDTVYEPVIENDTINI